ncbi:hypothetical protein ACFQZ2_03055 [Streptomonospora algeriensis]|uniref:Uncharacterized protein n=1 Tax=Streptomonospora algeriensis TaxID=995084 RepID=A0ABW3BBH6_9ACTN
MPHQGPAPRPVDFSVLEKRLADIDLDEDHPLKPGELGRLRVEVLTELASRPDNEQAPPDDVLKGVCQLAAETLRTVADLAQSQPKPTLLWNEELDIAEFMGRTLLLADHILLDDGVFTAVQRQGDNQRFRRAAQQQLRFAELIKSGSVIPVVKGVAMAMHGDSAMELTRRDLQEESILRWVREQLILEGPTAREALFVRAIDDFARDSANFWLYSHIRDPEEDASEGALRVRAVALQPYDSNRDYTPWIKQVTDSAISSLVQRTNQRIVGADMFAADYIAATPFEARLLERRNRTSSNSPAQAAIWANIPMLPDLFSRDLAAILTQEDAVENLRRRVAAALSTARTLETSTDTLTQLAHELEAESHKLEKQMGAKLRGQFQESGGLGAASMFIGGLSGGLPGVAGAALTTINGVSSYLRERANSRREAAYLFVRARKA